MRLIFVDLVALDSVINARTRVCTYRLFYETRWNTQKSTAHAYIELALQIHNDGACLLEEAIVLI